MSLDWVREAALAACDRELREGVFESLLDEVRRTVVRATVRLALGSDELVPLATEAVRDIDRSIKMIGRAELPIRLQLAAALRHTLAAPDGWQLASYLGVSRDEVFEVFAIANLVGGSICIPHTRRALEYWEELEAAV